MILRLAPNAATQAKELSQAHLHKGIAFVGLAQEEGAKAAFRDALHYDPALRLKKGEQPDRVVRIFEAARTGKTKSVLERPSDAPKKAGVGAGAIAAIVAGGVAVAGGAAVVASGGGQPTTTAPTPAATPIPTPTPTPTPAPQSSLHGQTCLSNTNPVFRRTVSVGSGTSAANLYCEGGSGWVMRLSIEQAGNVLAAGTTVETRVLGDYREYAAPTLLAAAVPGSCDVVVSLISAGHSDTRQRQVCPSDTVFCAVDFTYPSP